MAVEREPGFVLNLNDVLEERIREFNNARKKIYAQREAEFQRRIVEEGLSYEEQLGYRKRQLEEEQRKPVPYNDFIEEIKDEISKLRKLARYEKIRNDYLENYTRYKEGKASINNVIQLLENQLSYTTDPDLRKEILNNLANARVELANSEREALENRILLAQKDKSIDLLNEVISDVNQKINEANLIGDKEQASYWSVKLFTLKTQKQNLVVENKNHDLELKASRLNAFQKLNLLNEMVNGADTSVPVIIDGKRWNSEAEYWQYQRDRYLQGQGSGDFKDFFEEYSNEIKNKTDKISSATRFGYIPISTIKQIDNEIKSLAQRQEFKPHVERLENVRTGILGYLVDKTSKAIMAESELYGEYERGFSALKRLEKEFGIDTSGNLSELYISQITKTPYYYQKLQDYARLRAEQIAQERGIEPWQTEEIEKIAEEEFKKITQVPIGEEKKTPLEEIVPEEEKAKIETEITTPTQTQPTTQKTEITKPKTETLEPAPLVKRPKEKITLTSAETQTKQPKTLYEYYTQQGQKLPTIQERGKIYEQLGLGKATEYKGSEEQNIKLLQELLKQKK